MDASGALHGIFGNIFSVSNQQLKKLNILVTNGKSSPYKSGAKKSGVYEDHRAIRTCGKQLAIKTWIFKRSSSENFLKSSHNLSVM